MSLRKWTLSHRLYVKIRRMESFSATFKAYVCRELKFVASQAYIIVGTQIEYKSFMETSSEGLLITFRTVLAAERNFISELR